ncbi:unnamed protein product [Candida verbasci]|uniref:Mitochondrial inner membrane protease ATP23 n=1 Tax=Candida verbasci TaxID=1227364 RepID=A0A9W4TW08_9ASCO|nr:unnamed protein product [Candida verbasci]
MTISSTKTLEEKYGDLELSPSSQIHGFEWWRRTLEYHTGLGPTFHNQKLKNQFEYDYVYRNLPAKCSNCYQYRDWILKYSPSVNFMMDHIKKLNKQQKDIINKENIVCGPCDFTKTGGFNPQFGILLCSNWIRNKYELEDILTHELIHVYDYLKFNMSYDNLRHHACTEIRASMLSGECRIWNEIFKSGLGNFGKKFQQCIKRKAILSVEQNPKCENHEQAEKIVNLVWNSCFNDTRPFERVYR